MTFFKYSFVHAVDRESDSTMCMKGEETFGKSYCAIISARSMIYVANKVL